MTTYFNDAPITSSRDDLFGVAPFARALARGIQEMQAPEGVVFAIDGSWGSGKTSVINLIKEELESKEKKTIKVVSYAPWSVKGTDAVILGFLQSLYAAMDRGPVLKVRDGLAQKMRRILPHLARGAESAGEAAGHLMGAPPGTGGAMAGAATSYLDSFFNNVEPEDSYAKLRSVLQRSKLRYLMVIDDLDRLEPDELITIFRLVKSVGRLPNVIYLLVLDRRYADKILTDRGFSDKNSDYLEKIIQCIFEVPDAEPVTLREFFLEKIELICGPPKDQADAVEFMNVFYDCIAPWLQTPRDLNRILNGLSIGFPVVRDEVSVADFVALETLKIFAPETYRAVRRQKDSLCRAPSQETRQLSEDIGKQYDEALALPANKEKVKRLRLMLSRMFPYLANVWNSEMYAAVAEERWQRERRLCSSEHFDTYFRLSLSEAILPAKRITSLLNDVHDVEFVKNFFQAALDTKIRNSRTQASLFLEELNIRSEDISDQNVVPLLQALSCIADDLDVEADEGSHAWPSINNRWRLHWLINKLVRDRFDLERSSEILEQIVEVSSLGWAVDLAQRMREEYLFKEAGKHRPLVNEASSQRIAASALQRLRLATRGSNIPFPERWLSRVLFAWLALCDNDEREVKSWTNRMLAYDKFVVLAAKAATQVRRVHSNRDLVGTPEDFVDDKAFSKVLDMDRLMARAQAMIKSPHTQTDVKMILERFQSAEWVGTKADQG